MIVGKQVAGIPTTRDEGFTRRKRRAGCQPFWGPGLTMLSTRDFDTPTAAAMARTDCPLACMVRIFSRSRMMRFRPSAVASYRACDHTARTGRLARVGTRRSNDSAVVQGTATPHTDFADIDEHEVARTQEFVLRWSPEAGAPYREIVRQQWNFSPSNTVRELEDYRVELSNVSVLELIISPDIGHARAVASRTQLPIG